MSRPLNEGVVPIAETEARDVRLVVRVLISDSGPERIIVAADHGCWEQLGVEVRQWLRRRLDE